MDLFYFALIPLSLILPHVIFAIILCIICRNISTKTLLISSFLFFISLVIFPSIFPFLYFAHESHKSNMWIAFLKLSFFGKNHKLYTEHEIVVPIYFYYLNEAISSFISAWFTSKFYQFFNWVCQKISTRQPAQN